jgi:hypothetical protein
MMFGRLFFLFFIKKSKKQAPKQNIFVTTSPVAPSRLRQKRIRFSPENEPAK